MSKNDARLDALAEHVISHGLHGSLLNTVKASKSYKGILHAIVLAGGFASLAEHFGVSYQVVQKWNRLGYVPTTRVAEIERLYGISREELIHPKHRQKVASRGA